MFSLHAKSALVLGAAGGIGAATARAMAAAGACVTLADVEPPDAVTEELRADGHPVRGAICDVSDRAVVDALVASCAPLDIAVYAVGISPWDDWTGPDWDAAFAQVIAVNLKGAVDFARAACAAMTPRGGRIVLVSSLAGVNGGLIASPHYVASKGGLNAFVKWLARRYGPAGILVNAVAPASVRTPMMRGQNIDLARIPLSRMAEPEEVAGPIVFLCSPASSYVTGVVLDVNGGVSMG